MERTQTIKPSNQYLQIREYGLDANSVFEDARSEALNLQPSFIADLMILPAMKALSLYFAEDKKFEDLGHGKLSKGLFICGNVGIGKTLLMKAFRNNCRKSYLVTSTNSLNQAYMINGIDALTTYYGQYIRGEDYRAFCFDDLGIENSSVKNMGNDLSVMESVILSRYERGIPFHYTHFTSNIDASQIEKIYGTRVRSRLREMINFIVLEGTDRRK